MSWNFAVQLIGSLALLLLAALTLASPSFAADELRGTARMIDGDTLEVAGRDVRLWGINAPELDAAGGRASRDHMRELVAGQGACGGTARLPASILEPVIRLTAVWNIGLSPRSYG